MAELPPPKSPAEIRKERERKELPAPPSPKEIREEREGKKRAAKVPPIPIPPAGEPPLIPLLAVPTSDLPPGEHKTGPDGELIIYDPMGGQTAWMETPIPGYYIQLGGETYETRLQPFIPTTPSKDLRKALKEFSQLTGREQFEQAVKIGLIPTGSEYVEREDGWSYIDPAQTAKQLEGWKQQQRALGYSEKRIAEQLREIQSDKYMIYDPATGVFVPTYREAALAREAVGLTPRELKEVESGQYKVYDYGTDEWVSVTEKQYEERDAFYRLFPGIGPPGTPGKMTPVEMQREYEEFQDKVARGEIILLPDGQYMTKEVFQEQPEGTQQILLAKGIAGLEDIQKKEWMDVFTHEVYSVEEYQELIKEKPWMQDRLVLTPESGRRLMAKGLAFVVPPAKALLPEYTIEDVSAVEWGLGAVNMLLIAAAFAPGALLATSVSRAAILGISATGAGMIGYETAKQWENLSPAMRAVGVGGTLLYALPTLAVAARGIKFSTVRVPAREAGGRVAGFTPEGTPMGPIAWRGLSVFQNPIIGRSGGRWVVGARNITLPEARLIMDGYKPEMMLETKVFVDRAALRKANFSEAQIDYLSLTLKDRNLFAGKRSPFTAKEELLKPTERLDADEIQVLLRQIAKHNKEIKQVDMLYGSTTIKTQLAPELRGWRRVHDWDISTAMSSDDTAAFAKRILDELNKLGGGRLYRINPKSPTLIEKRIGGKWQHIVDIHSHEVVPGTGLPEIPESKLDVTGKYSYGRMVTEPAITVEYPGIGKFDIMRLSESGVRKADTILRVRQTELGTVFMPPERGIARPGVPKDAADFYVILRTFKGKEIADEWARAWARAMGYTPEEMSRVLPRIIRAMEEVASQTPSDLIGYRFYPSGAEVPVGASPGIALHIPRSLAASVIASPGLERSISLPIYPYKTVAATPSPPVTSLASFERSLAMLAPISILVSRPRVAGTVLAAPSWASVMVPSPKVTPSVVSPRPSPLPSVAPSVSVPPSVPPSLVPTPVPTPIPTLTPIPEPVPTPPPSRLPRRVTEMEPERVKIPPGSITWRQGALKGGDVIKYISPPYTQLKPITLIGQLPEGWHRYGRTPAETIQIIGEAKDIPERVSVDLGFVDILVIGGQRIEFVGGGLETDVGTRIPAKTMGMSIPSGPEASLGGVLALQPESAIRREEAVASLVLSPELEKGVSTRKERRRRKPRAPRQVVSLKDILL